MCHASTSLYVIQLCDIDALMQANIYIKPAALAPLPGLKAVRPLSGPWKPSYPMPSQARSAPRVIHKFGFSIIIIRLNIFEANEDVKEDS